MFVRATLVLGTIENATIVPFSAITTRDGRSGIFVVHPDRDTVSWRPVSLGVRQSERIQILGDPLSGSVVTLGQQLLGEGSAVTIDSEASATRTATTTP